MRIEVEVPDRSGNLPVYIFQDRELVAQLMYPHKEWEIKTGICSHCGRCCKQYHDKKELLPTTIEDGCRNLQQRDDGTWWCKTYVPISCLLSNTAGIPECKVRFSKT